MNHKTENSIHQQNLIDALHNLPESWDITPLGKRGKDGNINPKAPYVSKWQEVCTDREAIENDIRSGKAIGIGLKLGTASDGLVAIDFDGQSAIDSWLKKFGELPVTVTWTSGKKGRYQALFQVPSESEVLNVGAHTS